MTGKTPKQQVMGSVEAHKKRQQGCTGFSVDLTVMDSFSGQKGEVSLPSFAPRMITPLPETCPKP